MQDVKLDDDDVLSELINEIDESGPVIANKPAVASTSSSVISEKQATREYMRTFSLPKRSTPNVANKENKTSNSQNVVEKTVTPPPVEKPEPEIVEEPNECTVDESVDNLQQDSVFDDDFDMTQVEEFDEETKEVLKEEQPLNGWESMQQGIENSTQKTVIVNSAELPVVQNEEGKKVINIIVKIASQYFIFNVLFII